MSIQAFRKCMPHIRALLSSSKALGFRAFGLQHCAHTNLPRVQPPLQLSRTRNSNTSRPTSSVRSQEDAQSLLSGAADAPVSTESTNGRTAVTGLLSNGEGQITLSAPKAPLAPGLYLVGTPIGNLEDITLRALRVLRDSHAILAEDTRHSGRLLQAYGITTRLHSFHAHNEKAKEDQVLQLLGSGQAVALISDAGMPLISDPGASLVRRVAGQGIPVYPIPGPSAPLAALVASGLATDRFQFCGFLPPKQGARSTAIKQLSGCSATLLFFAPPHSLVHILADLAQILGPSRQCVVARELTKMHEEFYRGSLSEAHAEFSSRTPKGEITIVVAGAAEAGQGSAVLADSDIRLRLEELLAAGCSPSSAAKLLAKQLNVSKNHVYDIATQLATKGSRNS